MSESVLPSLTGAVSDALAEADEMVVKWVAVVETIGADGDRGVWTLTQDGATSWDALGLLTYALQREQAALLVAADDDGS